MSTEPFHIILTEDEHREYRIRPKEIQDRLPIERIRIRQSLAHKLALRMLSLRTDASEKLKEMYKKYPAYGFYTGIDRHSFDTRRVYSMYGNDASGYKLHTLTGHLFMDNEFSVVEPYKVRQIEDWSEEQYKKIYLSPPEHRFLWFDPLGGFAIKTTPQNTKA